MCVCVYVIPVMNKELHIQRLEKQVCVYVYVRPYVCLYFCVRLS